jgi:cell division protein ZapA
MRNTVEVVIAGKVFKISGYESAEYLHQISVYLNDKLAEFQKLDSYRRQNADQKQLMLNMNLADDFFKAKRQADKLAEELEKKEREMYGIRHDLIEAQLEKEKLEKENEELRAQLARKESSGGRKTEHATKRGQS